MTKQAGMSREEYIAGRLEDQIAWFDRKSGANQRVYKRLRIAEIFVAASIPFLAGYSENSPSVLFTVGLSGVAVAVISGLLALNRYQENWVEYRATSEALQRHRYRYLTQSAPYQTDDRFTILVDNVEALLSKENGNWSETQQPQGQ